jgi:hypothetical protein
MRNRLYAMTTLLAALYGCDNPEPTAMAAKPCHCLPAPPQEGQSSEPDDHQARLYTHRERHDDEEHRYSYRQYQEGSTEEQSTSSSDYQSQSRSYDEGEGAEATASTAGSATVWVDGYGRSHVEASDQTQSGAVSVPPAPAERRDPWHAYDSKCDEKK